MGEMETAIFRSELLDRRRRLELAATGLADQAYLRQLLQEVDSALTRVDQGSFGLCDVCHDPIERERLLADPLIRLCLDHLTAKQKDDLEQDLDLARQIQTTLLPSPHLLWEGWEASYHYEPAGLVSGDYCDLIPFRNGAEGFFFLTGDISGKGVAASLLMSHLHAIFRSLLSVGLPLTQLLERANRVFCESTMPSSYATLVCGRAGSQGQVEISSAGHCLPLLIHDGKATGLQASGLPLGLFCETRYAADSLRFLPGDTLVLYTDGLTEARNPSDEEYGLSRLLRVLEDSSQLPPQTLVQACLEDLSAFLGRAPKADDLTLLVIRRTGDHAQ